MIRLRGLDYKVHHFNDDLYEHGDMPHLGIPGTPLGVIDQMKSIVYINDESSAQQQEETFWHEAVHGLTFNENMSEPMVGRLASSIYAFLKDNGMLEEGWLDKFIDKEESGENLDDSSSVRTVDRAKKESMA